MSGSRTVPGCPLTLGTVWLADYYSILLLGWLVEELSGVVMSNQRFLKIVSFRFPTYVPKKIEYIRF